MQVGVIGFHGIGLALVIHGEMGPEVESQVLIGGQFITVVPMGLRRLVGQRLQDVIIHLQSGTPANDAAYQAVYDVMMKAFFVCSMKVCNFVHLHGFHRIWHRSRRQLS